MKAGEGVGGQATRSYLLIPGIEKLKTNRLRTLLRTRKSSIKGEKRRLEVAALANQIKG